MRSTLAAAGCRDCITLFARAAPDAAVFGQVLADYFGGVADPATDERLSAG